MPAITLDVDDLNKKIGDEADKQGLDIGQPKNEEKKVEAKTEEKEAEKDGEKEEVVYRQTLKVNGREIVLEGATPQEVLGKVSAALEAATPAEKKEAPKLVAKLSQDELFNIGAKLQQGKVEAIDEYIRKSGIVERILEEQGVKVSELKEAVTESLDGKVVDKWRTATTEFTSAHPDYIPTELNKKLMGYKIAELNLTQTPSLETLERAYQACANDGLLQTEAPTGDEKKEPPKKKAAGSSIFGTGQTGAGRNKAASDQSKVEAEIAKLQNRMEKGEITAREFMDGYNSVLAEASAST